MDTRHREREQDLHVRYSAYQASHSKEIAALFDRLPADDQDTIRVAARARTLGFSGSLQSWMTNFHIARITAEKLSTPVKSFEEWKLDQAT